MPAHVVALVPRPIDPALDARWAAVVTHTHNLRVRQVPFADAKTQLIGWCDRHGVRAVGLGSPWEPVSGASYGRYEGPDRDLYYSGRLDPTALLDREAVEGLISELNERAPRLRWPATTSRYGRRRCGWPVSPFTSRSGSSSW